MSHPHVKYLLVGGGLAASAAAQAIRRRDPQGTLLLVGQEINRPYVRPMLSKQFLRRETGKGDLYTLPAEWFADNHVQLRTGRRAVHLDVARDSATLDNGEEISFDRLLLATGASAAPLQVPGANLPNLFYLRTIEDAERLHTAVEKAKREGRPHARGRGKVVVIGAGLLGVEVSTSLTKLGLDVALVGRGPHVWDKFAGEATGRFVAKFLQRNGLTVYPADRPERIEGDGRLQRVVLGGGTVLDADFAIAAVGMTIHKELLRGTPIAAESAVLVNEHCRTNQEHVYAAGDCAAVLDPLFGKHRVIDHWDHAADTGRIAGANMAGGDERYAMVSKYATELFGLKATVWGEARLVHHRLLRGTPDIDAPDFVEIGVAADGRVAQVVSVGHTGEDALLSDLVSSRLQVNGNEELLKDPSSSLRKLLGR